MSDKTQLRKLAEERLLAEAVRDWRAGRAHLSSNGKHFKLRADGASHGNKGAPWGKVVKKVLGTDSDPMGTRALSRLGDETYGGREAPTEFERMHNMDRVRTRLMSEIAEGRPAIPPGTKRG